MEFDERLAEMVGVHFGDGMLSSHNYTYKAGYSLNSKNKAYIGRVKGLFEHCFGVVLREREEKGRNAVLLYHYSKKTFLELQEVGVPLSPKRGLRVPFWVREDEQFLAAFLKGLFDTDGCETIQRGGKYRYPLRKYSMKGEGFAEDIKSCLAILGIRSFICRSKEGCYVVMRGDRVPLFDELVRRKTGGTGTFPTTRS